MSRIVKIAVASLLADEHTEAPGVMADRAAQAVAQAGAYAPDIVVLPELFDVVTLPLADWRGRAEKVPGDGPLQSRFSALARQYRTHVVICLCELDGENMYNTAVLLGRDGEFIGKYRKSHLAPGEEDTMAAGREYPVFETDFGRVAMSICMDIHSPELFRIYALEGADLVVHPTMWRDYTGDLCESIANARAIDNQFYLATSHYIRMPFLTGDWMGHARVIDPYGRTRADTSHRPGVAVAEVDLDEVYEFWAQQGSPLKKKYPTLKECFFLIRQPDTYEVLTRPDEENRWRLSAPRLFRP